MNDRLRAISYQLPAIHKLSNPCQLCMHRCRVNRQNAERGFCRTGSKIAVYSYSPHYGEEPPLSGNRGSGTIFFTHCNMRCIYCQNYAFSQESDLNEVENEELAEMMLELQNSRCHNINLVSPTHYACQIVEALQIAIKHGLKLPIVYNTGGYDDVDLIKLLDGIIEIYLPDMRYATDEMAKKYSNAPDYVKNNRDIVKEMFRQVGVLKLNKEGIAEKGVIVRLLIIPNNVSGTIETLKFLKDEVSQDIYLSVMSQYHPTYKARDFPEIARRMTEKEYRQVLKAVRELGFTNGWIQGFMTVADHFLGTNIKPKFA